MNWMRTEDTFEDWVLCHSNIKSADHEEPRTENEKKMAREVKEKPCVSLKTYKNIRGKSNT